MSGRTVARILIVDDEVPQVEALCASLSMKGYATTGYHSAKQAIAQATAGEFDLVLTDLSMPEMDGISLLRALRAIDDTLCGVMRKVRRTPGATFLFTLGAPTHGLPTSATLDA